MIRSTGSGWQHIHFWRRITLVSQNNDDLGIVYFLDLPKRLFSLMGFGVGFSLTVNRHEINEPAVLWFGDLF